MGNDTSIAQSPNVPTREDISAAATRIEPYIRATPVFTPPAGSFGLDYPVALKLEHLQITGSFKIRGAFNNLLSRPVPVAGVIAASGGNHGAGVAHAATTLGHTSKIFVPRTIAKEEKLRRMRAFGAESVLTEGSVAECMAAYAAEAQATGALDVHPYDTVPTLAGQGSVALEMERQIDGLDTIIASARKHGALIMLDTYHAAGAMPMHVDELDVDFAIGGSYKYVRGSAGACWLWVNPRHLSESSEPSMRTLDTGWFAKAGTMEFTRADVPHLRPGGDAWLESTPPVLAFVQALAGLELLDTIGIDRVAAYNAEQQQHLAEALAAQDVPLHLLSPRGAFLTALRKDPAGVVIDARHDAVGRGLLRFCPDLLNTRRELTDAAEITGAVLGRSAAVRG